MEEDTPWDCLIWARGNGNNYQLEIVNSRPVTTADFNLTGISAGQPQPSFYVESGEGLAVTLTGNGLVNPSTQGVGVGGNNLIDVGEELHVAVEHVTPKGVAATPLLPPRQVHTHGLKLQRLSPG